MEFQKVQQINLKEKINFIDSVCIAYKKALLDQNGTLLQKKPKDQQLIDFVNRVLNVMDSEQKKIIKNDFIFKNNTNWWIDCYSKSNYYLKRRQAINYFSFYLFS